jgi:hypothetical protein
MFEHIGNKSMPLTGTLRAVTARANARVARDLAPIIKELQAGRASIAHADGGKAVIPPRVFFNQVAPF